MNKFIGYLKRFPIYMSIFFMLVVTAGLSQMYLTLTFLSIGWWFFSFKRYCRMMDSAEFSYSQWIVPGPVKEQLVRQERLEQFEEFDLFMYKVKHDHILLVFKFFSQLMVASLLFALIVLSIDSVKYAAPAGFTIFWACLLFMVAPQGFRVRMDINANKQGK